MIKVRPALDKREMFLGLITVWMACFFPFPHIIADSKVCMSTAGWVGRAGRVVGQGQLIPRQLDVNGQN